MRNKLFILLTIFFLCVYTRMVNAQTEKLKAAYIYNFTQQMKWPENLNSEEFIIGILGKNQMVGNQLKALTGKRTVGSQMIKIEEYRNVNEIQHCHILFIPNQHSGLLKKAVAILGNYPTVIITENTNRNPSQSTINLLTEDGKLTFFINENNINSKKIVASSKLLNLAKK